MHSVKNLSLKMYNLDGRNFTFGKQFGAALLIRKIGTKLLGDGRQMLNIMKNIHLTRTPVGQASSIQRRQFGCIDTGG